MDATDKLEAEAVFKEQHKEVFEICQLSFVSKKMVFSFIGSVSVVLISIAGGIILQCNSDARENGSQNVEITSLKKADVEMRELLNKSVDASTEINKKQQEILDAVNGLKQDNHRRGGGR